MLIPSSLISSKNVKISMLLTLPVVDYIISIVKVHRISIFNLGYFDLQIEPAQVGFLLIFFRYHSVFLFKTLIDLIIFDLPGKLRRFVVIYTLLSVAYNSRVSIRTQVNELCPLVSITNIFQNANWLEREAWDMFGVFFFQHPDLRRLLTDYGFNGYPLRKDFPLTGYLELWYSSFTNKLLYLPISLPQEFREFTYDSFNKFMSYWFEFNSSNILSDLKHSGFYDKKLYKQPVNSLLLFNFY